MNPIASLWWIHPSPKMPSPGSVASSVSGSGAHTTAQAAPSHVPKYEAFTGKGVNSLASARKFFVPDLTKGFMTKMRACFGKVSTAWNLLDTDKSGAVSQDEFRILLDKFNLPYTERDLHQIFALFDTDHSGTITYQEFNEKIGLILHEGETGGIGVTLQNKSDKLTKDFQSVRTPKILSLPASLKWNNNWRQVSCTPLPEDEIRAKYGESKSMKALTDEHGLPIMNNILSGHYYAEPHTRMANGGEFDFEKRWAKRNAHGQMWDAKRNQPLIASVIKQEFFEDAKKAAESRTMQKHNLHSFIDKNKRAPLAISQALYSKRNEYQLPHSTTVTPRGNPTGLPLASPRIPLSARSMQGLGANASKPPQPDVKIPITEKELNDLFGHDLEAGYVQVCDVYSILRSLKPCNAIHRKP
jgi:hypothetical protein